MDRTKSIELLNKAVAGEMTSCNQYMYFHFVCEDRGYRPLAKLFFKIAIEEMKHIELLALRILFLKGEIRLAPDAKVETIRDVKAMLEKSKQLETATIDLYNISAGACAALDDMGTKNIFDKLVSLEEGHFDEFDTEDENIKQFKDNYLALQSIENSKHYGREGE